MIVFLEIFFIHITQPSSQNFKNVFINIKLFERILLIYTINTLTTFFKKLFLRGYNTLFQFLRLKL
jgi:hypothetical protein